MAVAAQQASGAAGQAEGEAKPTVVIKKYANRRLYNTEASSYVTLDDLARMVREGRHFAVYDAKSGEDITRSVLTQIIVEEESKGRSLLPTSFLRQLIGLYGDSLQSVVPRYLEMTMGSFARQQEQMRSSVENAIGGFNPLVGLEELGRQNMAMMERAMSLFSPFPAKDHPAQAAAGRGDTEEVAALKAEIRFLREELGKKNSASGKDN
ncbi:polyhydroxyalkanoate synthesis repressor PhaR [Pseudoroseomonas globiformis]|uniref:Polyhydroxyalkanoate synthesis repressor PhaR n=1 Tax=Teichococcus globiformis TaxID=2307229 RepID=A0ABV7FYX6_9PROT